VDAAQPRRPPRRPRPRALDDCESWRRRRYGAGMIVCARCDKPAPIDLDELIGDPSLLPVVIPPGRRRAIARL
jgi:hypothetical protein